MTRGNQREIDRERARKRNAEKQSDNKRDQKSDFFKNKERYVWAYPATLKSCDRNRRSSRRNRTDRMRRSPKRRKNITKMTNLTEPSLLILHPINAPKHYSIHHQNRIKSIRYSLFVFLGRRLVSIVQELFLKLIQKLQVAQHILVQFHLFCSPVTLFGVEWSFFWPTVGTVAFYHLHLWRENVLRNYPVLALRPCYDGQLEPIAFTTFLLAWFSPN